MLIGVIPVVDEDSAKRLIKAALPFVDGVELRLDYGKKLDFDAIAKLRHQFAIPMIFTLRKKSQGGNYIDNEGQRLADITELCKLQPHFFDLEYDVPAEFIKKIHTLYPQIKLILSYHDFKETPADLVQLLEKMRNPYCFAYKITTQAESTLDALRMLHFVKANHKKHRLVGICMGELGASTRILNPIVGNLFNYASVSEEEKTAPGQINIKDLINIYHYNELNFETQIYALLGHPIQHSVGHLVHNKAIQALKKNAVYIKLDVLSDQLSSAIEVCRTLPFAGFSITMPLKEVIVNELDQLDESAQKIQTANSVIVKNHHWLGFNTDGQAAIDVLSKKINLSQKTVVILGAGGAAKAIAQAAINASAKVIILNRTIEKAKKLAKELNCQGDSLEKIAALKSMDYHVLINTLPISMNDEKSMQQLLKSDYLIANTIAMDVIYNPVNTIFLQIAKQANGVCIPGYELFIQQAILQIQMWFSPNESQIFAIKNMMSQFFTR